MEEPNAMQENTQNENLQPAVETVAPAAVNDADTINNPIPESETQATSVAEDVQTTAIAEEPSCEAEANNAQTQPDASVQALEPEATPTETEPEVDYSAYGREELVAALNSLLAEDVSKIRNRVSAIRNQFNTLNREVEKKAFDDFLEGGGKKEDYQPSSDRLANEFQQLYDLFRTRRQKMMEEIEAQKKRNFEAKQQLLEELRTLIAKDEESIKQTYDEFNAIQERWKNIGDVPRDKMNDLWQNYHFLIEQFFGKVKINKELRMLDLKRNLEQKIQLCERAEELIVETSVLKAFKALQELRAQWREIGPVPMEQNEVTWQRFNNAANQIDERRREYYDQRKDELEQNMLAKQALIDKASEITAEQPTTTKGWNDATEALDGLLKLWKTIGPVTREQNEEIWGKFKSIIDKHYADKKIHFGKVRDEQSENYAKKMELCLRAEAIAKREDWKKATEELLQLQAEWKAIGPTSRKVSEKIWHRFRGACDEFFAKKGEFFKDVRSSESENLKLKTAIIEEMKAYTFGENKEENLSAIKDFQRRWAEVGHVPMKEKDRITKEYRELLDDVFEQLKISAREAEETRYRERLRNVTGDAHKFVSNERQELLDSIEKIRGDLNLWENNLGFLANSKQADLLKAEFDKKMQNARQQIALMQAKLRILDEAQDDSKEDATENN